MNKLILLFGVLLCLVIVNARHYGERNDETLESEEETLRSQKEHNPHARRRRRRWQMNYGYPPLDYHYSDRRGYDRTNQEEVLQKIHKLLEDISSYIRQPPPPPPPPQPIYIPYPIIPFNYPQIQGAPCTPPKPDEKTPIAKTPNVTKRISENDMDPNRNWGLVVSDENDYDDGNDGARPISFDPIIPKQFMQRPAPKVEHGSVQASHVTEAPMFQDAPALSSMSAPSPGMCKAAIISCCGSSNQKRQQRQCFANMGCAQSFAEGSACSAESIQRALESFRVAYSPL